MSRSSEQQHQQADTWQLEEPEATYTDWDPSNFLFDAREYEAEPPELPTIPEEVLLQDSEINIREYNPQSSNETQVNDIFQQDLSLGLFEYESGEPSNTIPSEASFLHRPESEVQRDILLRRIEVLEAKVEEQEKKVLLLSE